MVGQISIFDLMKSDMSEWERFRDNYCKRQTATLCFNEMGKRTKMVSLIKLVVLEITGKKSRGITGNDALMIIVASSKG